MSLHIGIGSRLDARAALASFVLIANTAMAQSIDATAIYREPIALPTAAVLEAALEDASRVDAPAEAIARARIASPGNPPIAFTIAYDPAKILPDHRYVVRARILVNDRLLFTTETVPAVITRGRPTSVSVMLRWVGSNQSLSANPVGSSRPLEGTYWKAIELAGKPIPGETQGVKPTYCFSRKVASLAQTSATGVQVSYDLKNRRRHLRSITRTQMACLNSGEIESAYLLYSAINHAASRSSPYS